MMAEEIEKAMENGQTKGSSMDNAAVWMNLRQDQFNTKNIKDATIYTEAMKNS